MVIMILNLGLGLVFVAAAWPKLRHPRGFLVAVLAYHVLPSSMGRLYARLVPPLELLCALLLLSGTAVGDAGIVAALLLLSFIIAVGINVARGRDLECHCFGARRSQRLGRTLLLEDCALLACALAISAGAGPAPRLASWSIFRLLDPHLPGNGIPALVCMLLTAAATIMLPARPTRARNILGSVRSSWRRMPAHGDGDMMKGDMP